MFVEKGWGEIVMIVPFKRNKVKVTVSEMKRIEYLKAQAALATHPSEVKLFRAEINQIINHAKKRER